MRDLPPGLLCAPRVPGASAWYGASDAGSVYSGGRVRSADDRGNGDVRIRPGTLDDNFACAAVLADAINDLGHRHGSIDEGSAIDLGVQWPHWQPFMKHITRTAAEFWVAEAADREPIWMRS